MRQRQQAATALLSPKAIVAWRPGTLARHGNAAIASLAPALGQKQLSCNTIPGPVMAVR